MQEIRKLGKVYHFILTSRYKKMLSTFFIPQEKIFRWQPRQEWNGYASFSTGKNCRMFYLLVSYAVLCEEPVKLKVIRMVDRLRFTTCRIIFAL